MNMPVKELKVAGIASMIRDLSLFTDETPALEAAILAQNDNLSVYLNDDLEVRSERESGLLE
jgi:hypothetical protein